MSLSVCIFAHNEERLLPQCLMALDAAAAGEDIRVHILENGSSDKTLAVAKTFAALYDHVSVCEIPVADKANAWNEYVHRIAPEADCHIILDGDIRPSPASFKLLAMALANSPRAYGAIALPASGRSRRKWTARTLENHYISGNLYAMSGRAIQRFRDINLRFPFGAVGEDGILTYLLRTDLKGGTDDSHLDRISVAIGAFFEFDSLGPSIVDLKTYRGRARRYSERYFQKQLLFRRLKKLGAASMPDDVREIYDQKSLSRLRPRLDPFNFFVDCGTLKRLSKASPAL